mgnify:CR=1 FL=1
MKKYHLLPFLVLLMTYFNINAQRYPDLVSGFTERIVRYCNPEILNAKMQIYVEPYKNKKIYGNMDNEQIFIQAILDYVSGMTDRYAISAFNELLTFKK